MTTTEIVALLVSSVSTQSAAYLVATCRSLGMEEVPYKQIGGGENLPAFDTGYHFNFSLDGTGQAFFEVLERDSFVLQAGYQISFSRSLFGFAERKRFKKIGESLENHYGKGVPTMAGGPIEIIEYNNETTVAYVSCMTRTNSTVLTVRVGNRLFYDRE